MHPPGAAELRNFSARPPGIEQEGVDVRGVDGNEAKRILAFDMDHLPSPDVRLDRLQPRRLRRVDGRNDLHNA